MRYFKRLVAMVMVMALACTASAFAAEADKAEGTVHELYYTTYNEKGEIVEEGIIPLNEDSKYTWKDSITLGNGWCTCFRQQGRKAFYATDDTELTFSYKLDRRAKIKYYFYQDTVAETMYPTTWKSGTKTSSGTSISYTTNKDAYYFVGVTNVSSPAGASKSTFILPAHKGRRCESAFALLSHRESNKEVMPPCRGYGKMGLVRGLDDRKGG